MKKKIKMVKKIGSLFAVVLIVALSCIVPMSASGLNDSTDEYTAEKFPDKITNIYSGMKIYPHFEFTPSTNTNYGFRAYLGTSSGGFCGVGKFDGLLNIQKDVKVYPPTLFCYDKTDPEKLVNDVVLRWDVSFTNQPEFYHFDENAPTPERYQYVEGYSVIVVFYDIDVGDGVSADSFSLFSETLGNITYYGFRIDTIAQNYLNYEIYVDGITTVTDEYDEYYPMPTYKSGMNTVKASTVDLFLSEYYQIGYSDGLGDIDDKINEAYGNGFRAGNAVGSEYNLNGLIAGLVTAPVTFVKEAFNFEVFGINVSNFITMLMTLALVGIAVYFIVRLVK